MAFGNTFLVGFLRPGTADTLVSQALMVGALTGSHIPTSLRRFSMILASSLIRLSCAAVIHQGSNSCIFLLKSATGMRQITKCDCI